MNDQAGEGVAGGLVGLEFKSHPHRSYPERSLASNILGFVNREGLGYFGVEEKYDTLLAGSPVQVLVPTDPNKAFEIPTVWRAPCLSTYVAPLRCPNVCVTYQISVKLTRKLSTIT